MKLKKHEKLFSSENLIAYVCYSTGAIELHEDYIVFYKNILPFSCNVCGRKSFLINLSDINQIEYKGCGWYNGFFRLSFKHFQKPLKFIFFKWWVWRSKKLYKLIEPIYQFISNKIMIGWKNESYRKIQTTVEIKQLGVCPKCGSNIDESSDFCGFCGEKIR